MRLPALPFALSAVALATAAFSTTAAAEGGSSLPGGLQMSLILDAAAYTDDLKGHGNEFIGEAAGITHAHGGAHEHEGLEDGFNLGEAELVASATVDTLFDAYANLAFSAEGAEIEEAYFTTRSLPAGWQAKGGKFFSAFGYANAKHPHSWDFSDQNLAYLALIGDHGLNDTGLQLTWSPATDIYLQFGAELLQGHAQEKFGGEDVDLEEVAESVDAANSALTLNPALVGPPPTAAMLPDISRRGPQIQTAFVKIAPDLGAGQGLQLGLNLAHHSSAQEMHEELDPADNVVAVFYAEGEATLAGLEAVWKRDATGRYGQGAMSVQAEYLKLDKDLDVIWHTDPAQNGAALSGEQDGFYIQGTWGFAPRWQAGLRYDATGMSNELTEGGVTTALADSSRVSAALTFRPSEFTAWRLQLANADITDEKAVNEKFTQVFLQFNMSLGAHGAHAF